MIFKQKKGRSQTMDGRLIVYAKVKEQPELNNPRHPAMGMVQNGLLAAEGDYRYSQSIKDFFSEEMGLSLEEGFKELLSQFNMGDLPNQLDPETLKKRLENFKSMEGFIPKPAKMVTFSGEDEIMQKQGDIFYLGEFENFANANLAINSFPVLYQAVYKEQVNRKIQLEIEDILNQASGDLIQKETYAEFKGDLEKELLTKYIPSLFYSEASKKKDNNSENQLRSFLSGYPYPQEIKKLLEIVRDPQMEMKKKEYLVELYVKKIVALTKEDFKTLKEVQKKLDHEQ
jgi:hypothetical protein